MVKLNKKGFVASALVDFYAYILFIIILLVFFALLNLKGCVSDPSEQTISEYSDSIVEANDILMAYCRMPIEDTTMAEFIRKAYLEPDLRDNLELVTEEYLEKINDNIVSSAGYNIEVDVMPENNNIIKVQTYNVVMKSPVVEATQRLPLRNDKYILVTLIKESQ